MKYRLKNLTHRPVSIPCNSGSYCHLPPQYEQLLEAVEIANNALVSKLVDRGVLARAEAGAGDGRKTARTDEASAKRSAEAPKADKTAPRKRAGEG